MRKKCYFQKAVVAVLASAMIVGATPNLATPVQAATQNSIVVSNERDVLVAGRTYFVKNENATDFKSSNESVATVDKDGKITPLKTGYVTISATVNGETVKSKFMCVSKFGVTASQTKVNKMLQAENVKNISIVTTKDVDYQIAEGDYTKKTLTVKAPNADVDNHGTFQKIKVKDVAENTFRNYKPNKFIITDKNFRFAEKAEGSIIEVLEGAIGRLIAQGKNTEIKTKGNVEVKPHGKDASIAKVSVEGGKIDLNLKALPKAIKEVVIEQKADVKVSGGQKADIKITVEKDAAGTIIDSTCSVDLDVKAEVTVNLTDAAGGSKVDVAEGVKAEVKVDATVDKKVTVGETEVEAGNTAKVDETGKTEVEKTPTEGETEQKPDEDKKDDTTTPSIPGYVPGYPNYGTEKEKTYTVTFIAPITGFTETKIVKENEKVTPPTIDGFSVEGWYTDASFKSESYFYFNTPITKDITLYGNLIRVPSLETKVVSGSSIVKEGSTIITTGPSIKLTADVVNVSGSAIYSLDFKDLKDFDKVETLKGVTFKFDLDELPSVYACSIDFSPYYSDIFDTGWSWNPYYDGLEELKNYFEDIYLTEEKMIYLRVITNGPVKDAEQLGQITYKLTFEKQ